MLFNFYKKPYSIQYEGGQSAIVIGTDKPVCHYESWNYPIVRISSVLADTYVKFITSYDGNMDYDISTFNSRVYLEPTQYDNISSEGFKLYNLKINNEYKSIYTNYELDIADSTCMFVMNTENLKDGKEIEYRKRRYTESLNALKELTNLNISRIIINYT